VNFQFYIYDTETGGSPCWGPESHIGVQVVNGLFELQLGQNLPLDPACFDGSVLWLETWIAGAPLTPRKPITSSAYALGNVEAVRSGTGISVADETGPEPTVNLDTGYTDARYKMKGPDYEHEETVSAGDCETWTHNLGGDSDDYIVIMDGRGSGSTRRHQANFGTNPVSWIPERWIGAEWYNLSGTQITVCRGDFDNDASVPAEKQWDYIRIRIWENQH
jgi:hypothetical protein